MTQKTIRYLMKCLRIEETKVEDKNNDERRQSFIDFGNNPNYSSPKRLGTNQKISNLLNGIKSKYIKRDIKLLEPSQYSSSNFVNKFIVTRILGHPELDKELEKWREVNDCWICSKYAYTVVFYNKTLRKIHFHQLDVRDSTMSSVITQLIKANPDLMSNLEEEQSSENPLIAGTFTSWKFQKMLTLQEACAMIEKNQSISPPDECKKPVYKRTKKDQEIVTFYEQQIDLKYRKFWFQIFKDNLIYSPMYENYPYEYSANEDTFVYFSYIKPKKQDYVVLDSSGDKKELFFNQSVTAPRKEELKIIIKEYNRNIVQREFKKEHSVFASWKIDSPKEIINGFKKDIAKWKVARFVKDEADYEHV
jgi:hypothetical protein